MTAQSCCPVEIEITEAPPISSQQETLLDMHSVLNTFNILLGELQFLELELDDWQVLQPSLKSLEQLVNALGDRPTILAISSKSVIYGQRSQQTSKLHWLSTPQKPRPPMCRRQWPISNPSLMWWRCECNNSLTAKKAPTAWVEVPH